MGTHFMLTVEKQACRGLQTENFQSLWKHQPMQNMPSSKQSKQQSGEQQSGLLVQRISPSSAPAGQC